MTDEAYEQTGSKPEPRSWRKSSYSGPEGGECLEVAMVSARVLVRDSKHLRGTSLAFEASTWADFLRFASEQ